MTPCIPSFQKTALVLVDLQNDFCHPQGTASRRGKNVNKLQDTLANMLQLLKNARGKNVPIIHAVSQHSAWSESPSGKERFGRQGKNATLSYCEPGSWGAAIYHSFVPEPEEKIIIKHRYSAFLHTDLELTLRAHGIGHIILIGLYTNVCIDSTARDGYMRDFDVTVPYDCVASDDEKNYKVRLLML